MAGGDRLERKLASSPNTNPLTYVVPAVLYLVAAVATAILAAATGTDTITQPPRSGS